MGAEERSEGPNPSSQRGLRAFLNPSSRTWLLTVPLHLLAFLLLYLATARMMEREMRGVMDAAAEERLSRITAEMEEIAVAHPGANERGHVFGALIGAHWESALQLFTPAGSMIGPTVPMSDEDHARIVEFIRGESEQETWTSEIAGREFLRGLRRVWASERCRPCHEPGQTQAVMAISLDLTPMAQRMRGQSRRNLGILIVAWGALLGLINVVVRRSVRRSAARLEEQLAAAEAGVPTGIESGGLVLDPASARLHDALSDFLERQRRRQHELTSRLEHTDQLASLGQLAAGLAHEIKNPLAGIQGALEILSEDNSDERSAMLYDDMLNELGRVNTTLQLLLESARPTPLHLGPSDLRSLAKETVYLLRPGLERRKVKLRYEVAPDVGEVTMDASKIRQVLINLIQNAADAMEDGGTVTVRAGRFPDRGEGLILAVEDDGPGIPEQMQSKVFEPFFTTKFSGTGLGLAISKRLVEQHGGRLEVDSREGAGTTFYVLLPSDLGDDGDAQRTAVSAREDE